MLRTKASVTARTLFRHERRLASLAPTSRLFPNEPTHPSILSQSVPGPATSSASQQIGSFQDNKAHGLVVDYENSLGNWLVDVGECVDRKLHR